MSTSEPVVSAPQRFQVQCDPDVQITVYNGWGDLVGQDYGFFQRDLPAGLYEVRTELAGQIEVEIVRHQQATTRPVWAKSPPRYSAAPLASAETSHEYYTEPCQTWSQKNTRVEPIGPPGPAAARFLLFLRAVDRERTPGRRLAEGLRLVDPTGAILCDFRADRDAAARNDQAVWEEGKVIDRREPEWVGRDAVFDDTDGWLALSADVTCRTVFLESAGESPRTVPVHFYPGWETQLFLLHRGWPRFETLKVFLARRGGGFDPYDRDTQSIDLALTGLQNRTNLLPRGVVQDLLMGKFNNPMLGLIGAHFLLREEKRDAELVNLVLGKLSALLPESPDVHALEILAAQHLDQPISPRPLEYPPMLRAGLEAVLEASATVPTLLPEGSSLERISSRIYADTPWSSWKSLEGPWGGHLRLLLEPGSGAGGVEPWVERAVVSRILSALYQDQLLSLADLAHSLGLTSHAVGRALAGVVQDRKTLNEIALKLGGPVDEVWKHAGWKHAERIAREWAKERQPRGARPWAEHVNEQTPMGANLVADGATFRVWAPNARAVFVSGEFNGWRHGESERLVRDSRGYWAGFVRGVTDGDRYKFYVAGVGSEGFKRDPYARELTSDPPYPSCHCVVRDPWSYPWHDGGYRPPSWSDLILYRLHVGSFHRPGGGSRPGRFLDVLGRLDHLVALGVNAIELLPVIELAPPGSPSYDGLDLFAPEPAYLVPLEELGPHLEKVNWLLEHRGAPALTREQLAVPINQLKALVDLCHLYGLAVLLDVAYSHAGPGVMDQDEGLWFFDRQPGRVPDASLYFTGQRHGEIGGPLFALGKAEVRQFLIDNAQSWAREYHTDGFRYDRVGVIVRESPDGWRFCQDLMNTLGFLEPSDLKISEDGGLGAWLVRSSAVGGAGFDATRHDGLYKAVRAAVFQAAGGANHPVDLDPVAVNLSLPDFPAAWKAVPDLESPDVPERGYTRRLPKLADPNAPHSWPARSRCRTAVGLLLTVPGVPTLFMGQELLEDQSWVDHLGAQDMRSPGWERLDAGHLVTSEFLHFIRDLIVLRLRHPALRGELVNVYHVHNANRVLAFHRWLAGLGRDVIIIASLNESTFEEYRIGVPQPGRWLEVFNSEIYDTESPFPGAGHGGSLSADARPMHRLPASASIVIPANSLLVFARDGGD